MFEDATASEVVRRRATAEPTVPKPSNATRQGELTVTRFFLISPRETRGGNWHLNRDEAVAWLPWRHRAGPSATLDEARLSVVPATIAKRSARMQIDTSAYVDSSDDYAEHSPSITSGAKSAASPRSMKSAGTASPGRSFSRSVSVALTTSSSTRPKNAVAVSSAWRFLA